MRPKANPLIQPKQPPLNQRQHELWQNLNKFIMREGGWIVSQPDVSPIRFEAPLDSELQELLRQAGHQVTGYGTHERLVPTTFVEIRGAQKVTTTCVAPGTVGVWQLDLR